MENLSHKRDEHNWTRFGRALTCAAAVLLSSLSLDATQCRAQGPATAEKPAATATANAAADEAASTVEADVKAKTPKKGSTKAIPSSTDVAVEAVERSTSWSGLGKVAVVLALIIVPIIIGSWLAKILRMPDYAWKFALGIGSLAAAAVLVTTGEIKLGPDLSGGITLIYELANTTDQTVVHAANKGAKEDKAKDGAEHADGNAKSPAGQTGYRGLTGEDKTAALIKALTERVDPTGTKEVTIRKYGEGQIEIIIPNAEKQDLERIEYKIYTSGALEFRITASEKFARHRNIIELAKRLPPGENVVRLNIDGESTPVARWVEFDEKEFGPPEQAQIRGLVVRMSGKKPQALVMTDDQLNVTGEFLRSATPDVDETGRPQVSFVFNDRGAQLFGLLTGSHLPNPSGERYNLGILLDNQLLSAPTIESKITDRGRISGGTMSEREVEDLVGILNAGSLPAALNKEPISRAQISPTLGKETVRKGKIALIIALVVVAAFMLFYYRTAGWIAVFGLAANMLLILGVMVLIKGAFTLPGLAGLVLTVGMSVDANVLINERIRDELKRGSALRMAIRNGYSRAWICIFDSNVTNLIVAFVIYKIAPDNVKGFGVTLIIGIAMSIYAAVFLTRILFDVCEKKGWIRELKMRQFIGETNFDFIKWRRVWITASLITIAIGLAAAAARKSDLFDIDFTGGSSVTFVLNDDHKMDFATVLKKLEATPLGNQNLSLVEMGNTGSQFTVTTINDDVKKVEAVLKEAFGDSLKTYRVSVEKIEPIAANGRLGDSSRQLGATAWPLWPVTLLQSSPSDAAAVENAEEKADDAARTETEKSETESEDSPAEEASTSKSADAGDESSADEEASANVDAETAPDPFSGGTQATLVFSVDGGEGNAGGVNHTTLDQLVATALTTTGNEGVAYSISNPEYQDGSIRNYREWQVKLALTPEKAQTVFDKLQSSSNNRPVFPLSNKIGGRVAGRMAADAIAATILCLAGITAYVWFRFHRAVYGLAAVIALIHDVLVALGFVALSAYFVKYAQPLAEALLIDKFQVGLTMVAAFLTIIGYSLNDTIVIFDRIREVKGKSQRLTAKMINDSVNQTLARTLLTSFTTFMTIVVLYIFAGEGIHGFAFAMLIGVIAGSYSTIFIANPILLWMAERADKLTGVGSGASPREKNAMTTAGA